MFPAPRRKAPAVPEPGPRDLVADLTRWAHGCPWVDWLELAGSLGRGAGDDLSDVDAGLGVAEGEPFDERRDQALAAVTGFAPVAGSLVQRWRADAVHLVVVYRDGRQLSLVVAPASMREGLPPQARGLLDRSGRLAADLPPHTWAPDDETAAEWAFLAWIAVGDAARHAHRAHPWRALRSVTEARDLLWQLWAARHGLTFPMFGAVTVENAGVEPPPGLERTHPASLAAADLLEAAHALGLVLREVDESAPPELVRVTETRLAELRGSLPA